MTTDSVFDPLALMVMSNAVSMIAEEMGVVLERGALSLDAVISTSSPARNSAEVLLSGHFKDRQIAAIHHLHVHLTCRAHQFAKVLVEFRRAAGDVERRYALASEESEYDVDHFTRHFLGAVRTGVDVAMHARLVAAIAKINLQRVEPSPSDRGKGDLLE